MHTIISKIHILPALLIHLALSINLLYAFALGRSSGNVALTDFAVLAILVISWIIFVVSALGTIRSVWMWIAALAPTLAMVISLYV